jgi:hypothetical protein
MKRNHTHISRYLPAFLMLLLIPALTLISQTPVVFNYQALLRDSEGNPKVNTSVSLEIEIHQGTITGTVVYSETHNTNTDAFGVVNLALGSVNPGSFETIDWSAGPYFVEVSVDGTSMGTSELLAVPYARHAAFAATVDMALVDAATAGWDKNEADDFDGAFGSLSGIPAGLADGDDDTQLNEGQVEAFIDGNEASFSGWDKNAADDFNGAFGSLSGTPTTLSGYGVTDVERITVINSTCRTLSSVGTDYARLTNIGNFSKANASSPVEVTFQGRIACVGTYGGTGVIFELRVDDAASTVGRARANIQSSVNDDGRFVSITGIFTGLSAGTHTVSMWVRSSHGTSTDLYIDPGCWDTDVVIVREYR